MAVTSFEELKTGICALLGSPVPETDKGIPAGADSIALVMDGVPVALTYAAEIQPDRAFAFCAMGDCPSDIEVVALRRLLEMNFLLYRGSASSFGRDPMSGEVVFQCELLFDRTTPESALELLSKMVEQSGVWRRSHFLEDDAAAAMKAPGAAATSDSAWVRG